MKIRHPEKINNPINKIKKKPDWIRTRIVDTQNYFKTKEIINKKKLHKNKICFPLTLDYIDRICGCFSFFCHLT